jgi:putative SOS response-associated peptidase YedK
MCGRYKRPGKQKIAEAFALSEGLETTFDLEPDDNACSQSFLPVIHLNENGDRQIELMRWACVTAQALHRHSLAPQFCRVLTPFWDTSSIATDKWDEQVLRRRSKLFP